MRTVALLLAGWLLGAGGPHDRPSVGEPDGAARPVVENGSRPDAGDESSDRESTVERGQSATPVAAEDSRSKRPSFRVESGGATPPPAPPVAATCRACEPAAVAVGHFTDSTHVVLRV